jgi:CubicO group peptidase (beta-lactamase class C family)
MSSQKEMLYYEGWFIGGEQMNMVKPESVGISSERLKRLDTCMQGYVDRQQFAGIVTLVARHGQVAHFEKIGWQNLAAKQPMAADTIFRIYSMTKIITSAVVLMLAEEGKLRLSDPLSLYVPGFKQARVSIPRNGVDFDLVPANREILIHDLFTHTAGLSYGFEENSALDSLYRERLWTSQTNPAGLNLEEFITELAKLPLASQPGTAYRYSFSIDVLGYVAQLVSGLPLEELLQERIFGPLGMVDTAFWVPPEKIGRFAALYGPAKAGGLEEIVPNDGIPFTRPPRMTSGGGGLVSTAADYFRFGQMLLNKGELEGTRLLGRKTVEWMLQDHLPPGVPQTRAWNGFGLGGSVLIHPGLSPVPGSLGKFGWGGAANTEFWIDPVEDLLALIMVQYMPAFTIPLVEDFVMGVYQALE